MNLSNIRSNSVICALNARDVNFVISPGMRNVPIIRAILEQSNSNHIATIIDERAAAFYALGITKSTKRTSVLVCTSGSALSNYLPAILEAKHSHIPLIVLSADRPKELIDIGSNQTIDQLNVLTPHVQATLNFPDPTTDTSPTEIINRTIEVIDKGINLRGPIHINLPLKEPLTKESENLPTKYIDSFLKTKNEIADFVKDVEVDHKFDFKISKAKKPFIYVGELNKLDSISCLKELLNKSKIPCCLDIISSLKHSVKSLPSLDKKEVRDQIEKYSPDLLIYIGGRAVSKHVGLFFNKLNCLKIAADSIIDKHHRYITENCIQLSPEKIVTQLEQLNCPVEPLKIEGATPVDDSKLSYPLLPQLLIHYLPENSNLILSNSMAVRVFDNFSAFENKQINVFSKRGTSGIEGEIAHAAGIAKGSIDKQNVLIVGDISFLYDLNSLSCLTGIKKLTIIIANNGGGQIFNLLKIREEENIIKTITTPQSYDFEQIAKGFNLECISVSTPKELIKEFELISSNSNVKLINCKLDPELDRTTYLKG